MILKRSKPKGGNSERVASKLVQNQQELRQSGGRILARNRSSGKKLCTFSAKIFILENIACVAWRLDEPHQ